MNAVAYAKINLALHVRQRREDGYHDLETLFAFLDNGDQLSIKPAAVFELRERGVFAGRSGSVATNLITRAAQLANNGELPRLCIEIEKCLPVAAGLGGGSADAAATLRLLGGGNRLDLAAQLGADVPACVASVPAIGFGSGATLSPVQNDVSGLACLIVNPGVPLATGPVFANWSQVDRGPLPSGSAREIMISGRNDLEDAAIALCPMITDVLSALRKTNAITVRMSGSGASCFAIYADYERAADQERQIRADSSQNWWTMLGRLR